MKMVINSFLYIDPLKQGLKRYARIIPTMTMTVFLYIDPLKQGLKHRLKIKSNLSLCGFYT